MTDVFMPIEQTVDDTNMVNEIESLCVQCEENGITKLFLTSIPHFREVVVMAFSLSLIPI